MHTPASSPCKRQRTGRMLPPAKKIFGIPHICLDKIRKILYNIFCCFTICDRGGIGIRARLRGVSSNGYGFKSRRSHIFQSREKSRFFHFHQEYQAWHDVLASIDAPFGTPCSFVFPKIRHEKHARSCWLRAQTVKKPSGGVGGAAASPTFIRVSRLCRLRGLLILLAKSIPYKFGRPLVDRICFLEKVAFATFSTRCARSCWLRAYFSVLIYLANFLCLSPPPLPTDQSTQAILTVALSNRWVPHRAC